MPVSYTHLDVYKRQAHDHVELGAREVGEVLHLGDRPCGEHCDQDNPVNRTLLLSRGPVSLARAVSFQTGWTDLLEQGD